MILILFFFISVSIFLEASEKKPPLNELPPYHSFRQGQKITYQQLPNDIRRIITDYAGLNKPASYFDWTKLQSATFNSDFQQVQLLTILGADLDAISSTYYQQTALTLAIQTSKNIYKDNERKNKYNIAQYLIWRGANVNKPDKNQKTALHHATEQNNISALQLLLSAQANPNIKNKSHQTPLDQAHITAMNHNMKPSNRKKYYKITEILTRYDAKSSIPLEIMPSDKIMEQQYELQNKLIISLLLKSLSENPYS